MARQGTKTKAKKKINKDKYRTDKEDQKISKKQTHAHSRDQEEAVVDATTTTHMVIYNNCSPIFSKCYFHKEVRSYSDFGRLLGCCGMIV